MVAKAKLDDIIEGLEFATDESKSFLDRETGKVWFITDDVLHQADADPVLPDDIPKWQIPMFEAAIRIVLDPGRHPRLPSKYDIHEYSIMEDFCDSIDDSRLRDELFRAISGRGAFRNFKDVVTRRNLWPAWNEFRSNALREIAQEWCQENEIEYE